MQQLDQRLREVEGGDAQPSAATDRVAPPSVPSPADAGSDDDDYGDDDFEDEVRFGALGSVGGTLYNLHS